MKFQHWLADLRKKKITKTETPPQGSKDDNSDKARRLANPFALDPHPRSVPRITQTPPFLNYFGGQIERSVAQIEEIQRPRAQWRCAGIEKAY
jgi:hypothetical protein